MWQPEGQDNFDIYVKLVGLQDVRRLTTDPANDRGPSWSPDGTQIAFVRQGAHSNTIRLVSPIGGGERKLNDFPVSWWPIAWSPDGRYIAAGKGETSGDPGIYLLPTDGSEPLPIARAGPGVSHACIFPRRPSIRVQSPCKRTLDVIDLDTGLTAIGSPRTLTSHTPWTWGIAWNRDGTSVIYGAMNGNVASLWRVRADGGTAPERIDVAGVAAAWPAVASGGDRLAFSRDLNASIPYRFESGRPSRPLLTSTLFDGNLDFWPDSTADRVPGQVRSRRRRRSLDSRGRRIHAATTHSRPRAFSGQPPLVA